jgi:hypothetical protein
MTQWDDCISWLHAILIHVFFFLLTCCPSRLAKLLNSATALNLHL